MTSDARRYTIVSGIAFALLFGIGSGLWGLDMPEDGTSVAGILDFYRGAADRIVIGASMSVLGIGALVVFAASVRQLLAEAGDELLATVAFGGALLGLAAGIGAETINMAGGLRAQDGNLTGALAQALFEVSQPLGSIASGVGGGIFATATGVAALRTGRVLPWPWAVVVVALGVLMLTPLSHINVVPGGALVAFALVIAGALWRGPNSRPAAASPSARPAARRASPRT